MKILVTGAAGFIGSAVCRRLLDRGMKLWERTISRLLRPGVEYGRLSRLGIDKETVAWYKFTSGRTFPFHSHESGGHASHADAFHQRRIRQGHPSRSASGVRDSITHPQAYIESNVDGFINILEGCRDNGVKHLTSATSIRPA